MTLDRIQRAHAAQIQALFQSGDSELVYQACELLLALQDTPLITHFAEGSALDAARGVVVGARLRALVPPPHGGKVAFHLVILLIALGLHPPPEVLNLRYADLGPVGAQQLARCARLEHITRVDLRYNQLADAGAAALAEAPWLPSVRELRLHENQIGPDGVRALVGSPNLGPLAVLDLRDNPIGAAGAQAIADAPQLSGLRWLHLREDDVGEVGARALGGSPHLPLPVRRFWHARA